MQRRSADLWKKNLLEDLETEKVEFEIAEEFLFTLKKKYREGDKESVKVAELRRIKQIGRTIEEFI